MDNNFSSIKYNVAGNVLFLILVAVVLFAALSYAVTRSSRGGGDASAEQAKLAASQILQRMSMIKFSLDRLSVNGCDSTELSFENAAVNNLGDAGTYVNSNTPPTDCHVFHIDGASLSDAEVPERALNSSHAALEGYGNYLFERGLQIRVTIPVTANGYRLYTIVPYVTDAVCLAINEETGFDAIPADLDVVRSLSLFRGAYYSGASVACDTDPHGGLALRCGTESIGCFKAGTFEGSSSPVNIAYMMNIYNPP